MSFFASVKDRVYDKFGILDDAEDFYDDLANSKREFKTQGVVLKRLVEAIRDDIRTSKDVSSLKSGHYKGAVRVVDDILSKMGDNLKRVVRIERKARKDKAIWSAVSTKITTSKRHMQDALAKARDLKSGLNDMQREQVAVLNRMDEIADGSEGSGPASSSMTKTVAKILGAITALMATVLLASG